MLSIVRVESETPKQILKGVYQDWYITKPGYCLEDIPFFTQVKDGKPTSRDAFKLKTRVWMKLLIRQMLEEEFAECLVLRG